MLRPLCNMKPGDIFKYGGEEFILLKEPYEGCDYLECILRKPFCEIQFSRTMAQCVEGCYFTSDLMEAIDRWSNGFMASLPDGVCGEMGVSDMTLDGKYYCGIIKKFAAPLSIREYIDYKVYLDNDEEFSFWLMTPYTVAANSQKVRAIDKMIWAVVNYGDENGTTLMAKSHWSVLGARPKVCLSRHIWVEVDEEDEMVEDETVEEEIDLSSISSIELIKELAVRLARAGASSGDGEDQEEDYLDEDELDDLEDFL